MGLGLRPAGSGLSHPYALGLGIWGLCMPEKF